MNISLEVQIPLILFFLSTFVQSVNTHTHTHAHLKLKLRIKNKQKVQVYLQIKSNQIKSNNIFPTNKRKIFTF